MKVVLLVALMVTLALVHGRNKRPCLPSWNNNAYNNFLTRHIIQKFFDKNSFQDWKGYLQKKKLCRRPRQTFMEWKYKKQVEQICQGSGRRYNTYSNLCISNISFPVYELTVNTRNCQIERLAQRTKHVVVACDVVDNVCRPVHFERSTRFSPDKHFRRCR